jgi:hypothetical protein
VLPLIAIAEERKTGKWDEDNMFTRVANSRHKREGKKKKRRKFSRGRNEKCFEKQMKEGHTQRLCIKQAG